MSPVEGTMQECLSQIIVHGRAFADERSVAVRVVDSRDGRPKLVAPQPLVRVDGVLARIWPARAKVSAFLSFDKARELFTCPIRKQTQRAQDEVRS